MRSIPVLIIATRPDFVSRFTDAVSGFAVDVMESEPTYTSYINVLQYLPAAVVMELPKVFHDQLHFLQMLKQNSAASEIPVICFGGVLAGKVRDGLAKIGVTVYLSDPFDLKDLLETMVKLLRDRGIALSRRPRRRRARQKWPKDG